MKFSKEPLAELERVWVDWIPLLVDRLKPGLSEARIRRKLERKAVSGDIAVLFDVYGWHNGTTLDQQYVFSKKGTFPGPPFYFIDLDMAIADFLMLPGLAATRPQLREAIGRYFPIFWNGVVSWIAVDLRSGQGNPVVFIELEPTPRIWEAYPSVEEFIQDLIAANRENRTLKCFSRKEASPPERPQSVTETHPLTPSDETVEPSAGAVQSFVSEGGPHIVLPDAARAAWKGVSLDSYDVLDPSTDYGRACLVREPIGLLSVGGHEALVLAGSPPISGWMKAPKSGLIDLMVFERWPEEGPEDLAEAIVPKLKSSDFADSGLRWTVSGDGATLMSAADRPGNSAFGEVPVPIQSGMYSVLQARHESPGEAFWVFRLAPVTP